MTLEDLRVLQGLGLFNMAGVARHIQVDPQTLSARIRRNSPELSVTESEAIEAAFVVGFGAIGADLSFPRYRITVPVPDGVGREV